jgi:hypothetical protein
MSSRSLSCLGCILAISLITVISRSHNDQGNPPFALNNLTRSRDYATNELSDDSVNPDTSPGVLQILW